MELRASWFFLPAIALIIVGALVWQLKPVGTWSAWVGADAAVGFCSTDDQIMAADRTAMRDAALHFIAVLVADPSRSNALMSDDGQRAAGNMGVFAQALGVPHDLEHAPTRTYLLRFSSGAQNATKVPCGSLSGPVFVARGGTMQSGVVQFTEPVRLHDERVISVWMDFQRNAWRVRGIRYNYSGLNGSDAAQLWALARQQRTRGHALNAMMLYTAANGLIDPQAFVQPTIAQAFNADAATLPPLPDLHEPFPVMWASGGETFKILRLEYTVFDDGEVGLTVHHELREWRGNEAADVANRVLIDGFNQRYPGWQESFSAIIARAYRPGQDSGWATVYTRTTGYIAPRRAAPRSLSVTRTPGAPSVS